MHTIFWWYRLHFWQWVQSGRVRPLRSAFNSLVWWLPCVVVPLALLFCGAPAASAALSYLLGLDVPLTLVLTAATAVDAMGVESRAGTEDWLWPRAFRSTRIRWMSRQRWLYVARWPAGLAIAASLLASRAASPPESLTEMLVMTLLGLAGGSSFAWAMRRPIRSQQPQSGSNRSQGVAALSWVALREARDRFDLRRAAVLAVPALLAAPLGALADQVAKILALWLPLMFVLVVGRETAQVHGALRRWLATTPSSRLWLTYRVWRHVVLGMAAIATLGTLWWKFGAPMSARQ